MKNISHLSIVLISTILLSCANSICMEKEITCYLNPHYYHNLMDTIEEQLIKKEIERYGIYKVQNRLNDGIRSQKLFALLDQEKPVFIIKKTFFAPKMEKDLLTKSIYHAIVLRSLDEKSKLSKQFLSNQIRYYGIKDKPAVLVVAKLTNKERIQKIINAHKSTMVNNRIDNNVNPMSICALFVFGLSYLLIHHFIASN
jgi:hypothetical protein